jgi:glycyl-tRNA synthetase beta chain
MPDLLLELFSEEIPARMQAQAAKDLERLVVGALSDRGLLFEGAKAFAGPRRLTLAIAGLPAKQPDVSEEIKGPKTDAPQPAIDGFLKKTGLTLDALEKRDAGKGQVYFAVIRRAGRETAAVLAEVLPEVFAKLPWPKSMRFPGSAVRWVRPLHGIVATFDGEVVPFEFAGVASGRTTMGHRFLASGPIAVRHYDDYVAQLRKAHVVLDAEERKAIIFENLKQAAFVHGLEPIPDEGLLDEVAGLAEWPVVLIGAIEDRFMDVPAEILQTSMRTHQKYFALRDPKTGKMASRFALVSNMVASDGGKEIVAGNERVLRARLSDAKFFWDQDRKRTLESRVEDLKGIVFHAKLGTQYERVGRIGSIAGEIARIVDANATGVRRAAKLCKADLTTGVVGEFPELQGVMGRYYRLEEDRDDHEVADAIRDHYKPQGPSDTVPASKISVSVALADKADQIVGFFAIGERPTGSGDPFALRRAALGLIRLILERRLRVPLRHLISGTYHIRLKHWAARGELGFENEEHAAYRSLDDIDVETPGMGWLHVESVPLEVVVTRQLQSPENVLPLPRGSDLFDQIIGFLADRLKVALREKGTRHDLIDAVFSLGNEDDLVRLVARVEALQSFLKTDEGANLLAGYKRAANILKAEEKKDKTTFDGEPDPEALALPEEKALFVELATASEMIRAEVARERFVEAMGVMARLRGPVDAFFDKVKVNDDEPAVRANRLKLLARLRATLHQVADFSKIEG